MRLMLACSWCMHACYRVERLKAEEAERKRLEELEQQRQKLLAELFAKDAERCEAER
jgi:hypothetical protein